MKKAFDQTVRDIKREVNKKVLKVPSIEQKVLDATSNEPWGPHGSHLADIAQATRNYHEYQMIMAVMWKRINDTGKNWRHVYKALMVLEYLVARGSERVIDEIREHAYQISTLSDFQYIDSSGRDQGSNVRKKSQCLVVLVNDKERILEVRQKAAANRDKYQNVLVGRMYRSGSRGYGDHDDDDRYEGRYGSRDEDHNGYGGERKWSSRDDDKYGRYGDSYNRDGDHYGREYEEHYSRDGYRDDDSQYGWRSRSSDRDRDRTHEDDGQYSSSRGSGAKADDHSQEGSIAGQRLARKFSERNLGGPPSYEEAAGEARSPVYSERDGETSASCAPKSSSPPGSASPNQATTASGTPVPALAPAPAPENKEADGFDEFDPRGSFSAAPTMSSGAEIDLLGSLSESFSSNALAIMPATTTSEADASVNSATGSTFAEPKAVSTVSTQSFEDPFGDGPFKALTSADSVTAQPQNNATTSSAHPIANPSSQLPQSVDQDFGETFPAITYTPSGVSNAELPSTNPQYVLQEFSTHQDIDILADILPPSGPSSNTASQPVFPVPTSQYTSQTGFPVQSGEPAPQTAFVLQVGQPMPQADFLAQNTHSLSLTGHPTQAGQPAPLTGSPSQMSYAAQTGFLPPIGHASQTNVNVYGGFQPQLGSATPVPHMAPQIQSGPTAQPHTVNFVSQPGYATPRALPMGFQTPQVRPNTPMASQPALPTSTLSHAIVPQPAKDKFETKSTVWADTLSRGLVNLNISGPKINPMADIGVDFEAMNRKEKRMEKPTTAPVTSNITMGKAMGSGSGIGRAGASVIRPPPNPMVGSGMGIGLGGAPVAGIGMGGYGVVNQPMGLGMRANMPVNMGVPMQPPTGFQAGSTLPGGYNPMMGTGAYGQQPYGGGYR